MISNPENKQKRIGITGGIASGKTTIAKYISSFKKIKVLNADEIAKQFLLSETKSYKEIIQHFGHRIIDYSSPTQEIQTKLLKEIIFANPTEKIWLENIIHPLVKEKMNNKCMQMNDKCLILEIPLLFEANFTDLCTEIWLIKCSQKMQLKRLMNRDKISQKEAWRIINSQSNDINNIQNNSEFIYSPLITKSLYFYYSNCERLSLKNIYKILLN